VDTLLSVTLKWIHLIATVAWIGGMFTNFFIYLPSMAKALEPQVAGRLMGAVMKRFRIMVYVSMAVFLISGILLGQMDLNPGASVTARNQVVNILIFKIPLFVLMVVLAIVAFEIVAPRAARLAAEGPSPGLQKVQRTQKIMAVIGFILGLIILVLSAAL